MELRSPCGATMGQISYYYNGDIYTCDEGRMISEAGKRGFRKDSMLSNQINLGIIVTNRERFRVATR